jgi:hypothetical protein
MPVVAVVLHSIRQPSSELSALASTIRRVHLRRSMSLVATTSPFDLDSDHPIRSHTLALPSLAGLIRRFARGAGYAKSPQLGGATWVGSISPDLAGCQCEDGPVQPAWRSHTPCTPPPEVAPALPRYTCSIGVSAAQSRYWTRSTAGRAVTCHHYRAGMQVGASPASRSDGRCIVLATTSSQQPGTCFHIRYHSAPH